MVKQEQIAAWKASIIAWLRIELNFRNSSNNLSNKLIILRRKRRYIDGAASIQFDGHKKRWLMMMIQAEVSWAMRQQQNSMSMTQQPLKTPVPINGRRIHLKQKQNILNLIEMLILKSRLPSCCCCLVDSSSMIIWYTFRASLHGRLFQHPLLFLIAQQ